MKDTEFPGVVARPLGSFRTQAEFIYQTVRCNVDMLKIIQLGLTLADEQGNFPPDVCTWQFNFKFNLDLDTYSQESIDLLSSCGIDFDRFSKEGMEVEDFGELLTTSGLVLMPNIKWISFHSNYDFGYLLKVLTANPLPPDESQFFDLLHLFFPSFYDIKYLMKTCKSLKGGLQDIADDLAIERVGVQHQAGSDSLLTAKAFFKIRHVFFEDHMDDTKFSGFLFGLGTEAPTYTVKTQGLGNLTPSTSTSDIGSVSVLTSTPPTVTYSQ